MERTRHASPQSGITIKLIHFFALGISFSKTFSASKSLPLENFVYLCFVFNIIARRTLLEFCKKYPEAATALQEWYYELLRSDFKNFNEVKKVYGSVSLVGDDRVVFNIMGNKYRLVVRMVFEYKTIQIKWFGTHAEYDKVDVNAVKFKNK